MESVPLAPAGADICVIQLARLELANIEVPGSAIQKSVPWLPPVGGGVGFGVGDGDTEGDGVGVGIDVDVGVGNGVGVGVEVGNGDSEGDGIGVGVGVGVGVGDRLGVGVGVGVGDRLGVGVGLGEKLGDGDGQGDWLTTTRVTPMTMGMGRMHGSKPMGSIWMGLTLIVCGRAACPRGRAVAAARIEASVAADAADRNTSV